LTKFLAETDAGNAITTYYIYGIGLISRVLPNGTASYYHYDSRGSTVTLTDATQNVTDTYFYNPFGILINSSGTTPNPFKYVGRYGVMDEGNGIDYIRARYYSPELGRFIGRDPMAGNDGDSQSLIRYVYALNNPVRFIDASGYSPLEGTTSNYYGSSDENHNNLVQEPSNYNSKNSYTDSDHPIVGFVEIIPDAVLPFSPYQASNVTVDIAKNWSPVSKDLHNTPRGSMPSTAGGQTIRAAQCNFDETCMFGN
jgi:RHS repeat-associated protein